MLRHPYILIRLPNVNKAVLGSMIADARPEAVPAAFAAADASRPADRLRAVRLRLSAATPEDAPAIAGLRNAVAADLTAKYGKGWWSGQCTKMGVLFDLRVGRVYVARRRGKIIATLKLAARKPWAIDRKYFTPCERPLYLSAMAVTPGRQRQGIGRACLAEVERIAKSWPASAIFLDAFDHRAGAGPFYLKCGCREVGQTVYRKVPLLYFEMLV